ncbi:hypothetical protein EAF04_005433 [Stromatinia cepivora]|nr:hypothetical protein EAF04_005433 [Stromatinia cepivora]
MGLINMKNHFCWPRSSLSYFAHACRYSCLLPASAFTSKLVRSISCQSVMTSPTRILKNPTENVYFPEDDIEDLEDYRRGGYHPTIINDIFKDGRYTVVHKLGYGGYSTIWLARDHQLHRYVSLKILTSGASSYPTESKILRLLCDSDKTHEGKRFIPTLLDEFSIDGPNGHHLCLVGDPAGLNIAVSKEISSNWKFPVESARSIAAQLAMGLSYIYSRGVCHGDLHMRNFLLRIQSLDHLDTEELYKMYGGPFQIPIRRLDGKDPQPHAPSHAIYPMSFNMPADQILDPEIVICDYGTSFVISEESDQELYTPELYLPPEAFFNEPITPAADVWTLGVNLYEVLGERPLFETFAWDRDDIIAEMVSTLGRLPPRWWDSWVSRGEFFQPNGSWISANKLQRIMNPVFRPLHQRLWDMGRGEKPESCEWDVKGGEMRALEELLAAMLKFEPTQRLATEKLMASEYVTKWALPAWNRQMERGKKNS